MSVIRHAFSIVALCACAFTHVSASRAFSTIVTIKSKHTGEYVYEGVPELDSQRRRVLTYIPNTENPQVVDEYHFELTLLTNGYYTIKCKHNDEYLYVGGPKLDSQRRYVLSWIPKNEDPSQVIQYQFEIVSLFNGIYYIKSKYTGEYIYVGVPKLNSERRYVLTWIPKNEDPTAMTQYQFEINSLGTALASLASVPERSSAIEFAANLEGLSIGSAKVHEESNVSFPVWIAMAMAVGGVVGAGLVLAASSSRATPRGDALLA